MKKICLILSLFLIGGSAVLGILTKHSFTDHIQLNNVDNYIVRYTPDDSIPEEDFDSLIDTELEMLEHVNLIAKVKFTGQRVQKYECTLSTVDVLEVYRGDGTLKGKRINVYELNYFHSEGLYMNYTNLNLMKQGREYYVFMRKRDYMTEYQKKLKYFEYYGYLNYFSIIPVEKNMEHYFTPGKKLCWSAVKDYDYICFSQQRIDFLIKGQEVLLAEIGIENN